MTTWQVDSAHTSAEFAVRHLMISTVKGHFTDITGTVAFDESDPSVVDVNITIQTASIDTRQPQRDDHLRSADFFDVAKYPTITFHGKRLDGDPSDAFALTGDLTIHGVTKPITLSVAAEGRGPDPFGGAERAGFSATGKLDRRDYGLVWNMATEAGGIAVGHDVKLTLDLELVKPKVA